MKLIPSSQIADTAENLVMEWQERLSEHLPEFELEHIGSSAIAGAITKGDIDIYLEVPQSHHPLAIRILLQLGLTIKLDTHRDASLCMLEHRDFAMQVVAKDSEYVFFKTFRDALNGDPHLVEGYNTLKQRASNQSEDEYRRIKGEFIKQVLARYASFE